MEHGGLQCRGSFERLDGAWTAGYRARTMLPDGPFVLLSLVGLQPAAVLAFLKSWESAYGAPHGALLLATTGSKVFAGRVAREAASLQVQVDAVSSALASGSSGPDQTPDAVTSVKAFLAAHPGCRPVLFVNPGLAYQVAVLARALPADTVWVSGSSRGFEVYGEGLELQLLPAANLGLATVFRLHDLSYTEGAVRPPLDRWLEGTALPGGVVTGLTFDVANQPLTLDLAYERGGWVQGLVSIPAKSSGGERDAVLGAERLNRIRLALRPARGVGEFRLNMAVTKASRSANEHAQTAGIAVVNAAQLEKWLQGGGEHPGATVAETRDLPRGHVKATEGDGPPLVVWLGTDPSATLNSILTHRPGQALVCFDPATPAVKEQAIRLRESAKFLPCTDLKFIRASPGLQLANRLRAELVDPPPPTVRLDITPGTNTQSVALARLPFGQLWSQHRGRGEALCLESEDHVPLATPGLCLQATMAGGTLLKRGDLASGWDPKRVQFLLEAGKVLARARAAGTRVSRGREVRAEGLILRPDGQKHALLIDGTGRTTSGSWRQGGAFFEDLVAAGFRAAGAEEVRVNMMWSYTRAHQQELQKAFRNIVRRDEIDVCVKWDAVYYIVSCKTADAKAGAVSKEIRAALAEAESHSQLLGRFCIPLVCHLNASAGDLKTFGPSRKRAALLDLAVVIDPSRLKEFLAAVRAARTTLPG